MKKAYIILALLIVTIASKAQNFTIQVDTLREYRLHLPVNYNPANSYPLLFAFHGGFGLNWQFENETSFSDLADTANIIVVYPQAIGTTRSWNTGVCCGWAWNNNISDLDFVNSLVNHLTVTYNVDSNRIYATGFSSGAMMTYAVGCKFSSIFAAIAPVSSSMLVDECEPDCTPVPTIHLHAEPDSSALFHGGYSSNPLLQFYYPPVDSVMTAWSIKNNCNPVIDTTYLANGTRIYSWNNCQNNTYQQIWLADDGGHKWAGTPGTGILSGDSATQDFYATEIVWNFLRQFSKDCTPTVGIEEMVLESNTFKIFPNPSNTIINIECKKGFAIYNSTGQLVKKSDQSTNHINITDLPTGLYILKSENKIGRFIKSE